MTSKEKELNEKYEVLREEEKKVAKKVRRVKNQINKIERERREKKFQKFLDSTLFKEAIFRLDIQWPSLHCYDQKFVKEAQKELKYRGIYVDGCFLKLAPIGSTGEYYFRVDIRLGCALKDLYSFIKKYGIKYETDGWNDYNYTQWSRHLALSRVIIKGASGRSKRDCDWCKEGRISDIKKKPNYKHHKTRYFYID